MTNATHQILRKPAHCLPGLIIFVILLMALFVTEGAHAGPAFVMWTNVTSTIQVTGNSLKKITGTNVWDAGAVSTQAFSGDGYVEFTPGTTGTWRMCGLGNGDSSTNYTDIEYALFLDGGANLYIYESGTYRGQFGTYTGTDRLKVAVEGGVVKYYRNSTLLYTSTVPPQYPLLVDTSLNTQNESVFQLTNVVISSSAVEDRPALPLAQPYPTPTYNPQSYIQRATGGTVIVSANGQDLATLVQQAQDDPSNANKTISIQGGGSITNQVRLKRHTTFDSATYSCDTPGADAVTPGDTNNSLWYGCFLVDDGVLVEGTYMPPAELIAFFAQPNAATLARVQALTDAQLAGTGTTILEPTFHTTHPSITVFQTTKDAQSVQHDGEASNITIMGIHIVGRQTVYDGGTRQAMIFSNCVNCAAMNNYLEGTRAIGIQFGGSASSGKYARDFLAWHNITSGVAAANFAMVNGEDGIFAENYALKLGHLGFGGGVSGFDLETNAAEDHAKNIWVINSLYDYEGSMQDGAGNAINFQAPGVTVQTQNINAFNNWIIGGRSDGLHRYMSNGILVSAANNVTIKNNYIYKTGQNAIQWHGTPAATGTGSLVEDNWFDSTGGGGDATVRLNSTSGITFNRIRVTVEPAVPFSVDQRFQNCNGTNNTLTNTTFNGVPVVFTTECFP